MKSLTSKLGLKKQFHEDLIFVAVKFLVFGFPLSNV